MKLDIKAFRMPGKPLGQAYDQVLAKSSANAMEPQFIQNMAKTAPLSRISRNASNGRLMGSLRGNSMMERGLLRMGLSTRKTCKPSSAG